MIKNEVISIENVAGGSAQYLFQRELNKVIENIYDETAPEAEARSITINIKIAPNIEQAGIKRSERVKGLFFSAESNCKLCKSKTGTYQSFIDFNDEGFPIPVKHDPSQIDIFSQMSAKINSVEV